MADVVIIGGGISGVAAAYALAKEGVAVALLEQHDLAAMASGWTLAGVRQSGRHRHELPLAMAAVEIWKDLGAELDADIEYRQKGNLRLARDDAETTIIRRLVYEQKALGLDLDYLDDNSAIRAIAPAISDAVVAASFCPTDGHANPKATVNAYARAAERLGAKIHLGETVDEILVQRGRVVGARTQKAIYKASNIVITAGIHTPALLEPHGLSLPLALRMVTVVRTRPLPPLFDQVFGTANAICAGRQEASGRLRITGGSQVWQGVVERASDGHPVVRPPTSAIKGVIERGSFFLPAFGQAPLEDVWAGLLDMTPDGLPVIEATPEIDGLVVAAGFSGHGFGIGPVTGQLVRDLVLERPSNLSLDAFRRERFLTNDHRQVEPTLHG
ncbi:MAG: NAD(P)/FAD-dependent oxidoreductase [Geminicoccales bacterium]